MTIMAWSSRLSLWKACPLFSKLCRHIPPIPTGVTLVGDNLDKQVAPRDMRIDHQVKSIHHFHYYGAFNRVEVTEDFQCSPNESQADIKSLPVSTFLPSASDCAALKANYAVLVERILVEDIPCFQHLKTHVTKHIDHQYSEQMKEQSVTVSK